MQIIWWVLFCVGFVTAALGAHVLRKPVFDLVSEAIECRTGVYLSKSIVGFGATLLLAGFTLAFTASHFRGFLF